MGFKALLMPPAIVATGTPPITTYAEFMATKTPAIWYRFTEASGAAVNSGSAGSGFNGTVPAEWTQGQSGTISAVDAVRVDSTVNATMEVSGASAQGFTNLTFAVLLNLPTGTLNANTANFTSGASSNRLFCGINSDGTFSISIRVGDNFSQVDTSQLVPRNQWVWIVTRWNGSTGAINVRYITASGVASPTILYQDNSATGTLNLRYGYLGLGEVVNQKTDEYIYDNSVWSDEDLTTLQAVTPF